MHVARDSTNTHSLDRCSMRTRSNARLAGHVLALRQLARVCALTGGIFPSHLVTANISDVSNETMAYHVAPPREMEPKSRARGVYSHAIASAHLTFELHSEQAVNPSPYTKTQRLREAFARRAAMRASSSVTGGEAIAEWCDPVEQCSNRRQRQLLFSSDYKVGWN